MLVLKGLIDLRGIEAVSQQIIDLNEARRKLQDDYA
jgi:hypothetical protein